MTDKYSICPFMMNALFAVNSFRFYFYFILFFIHHPIKVFCHRIKSIVLFLRTEYPVKLSVELARVQFV